MLTPIAMYPWPAKQEHLNLAYRAYLEIDPGYEVTPVEAAPGGPVRVLAFGELPPWICDSGLIRDPNVYESVREALRWCLTAGAEDTRGHMVLDRLKELLGNDVKEIFDVEDNRVGNNQGSKSRVAFR